MKQSRKDERDEGLLTAILAWPFAVPIMSAVLCALVAGLVVYAALSRAIGNLQREVAVLQAGMKKQLKVVPLNFTFAADKADDPIKTEGKSGPVVQFRPDGKTNAVFTVRDTKPVAAWWVPRRISNDSMKGRHRVEVTPMGDRLQFTGGADEKSGTIEATVYILAEDSK
jgi:hypothetical protein